VTTTTIDPAIVADGGTAANGITIDAAVETYRRHLRAGNKSPNTIKTYLVALSDFNRFLRAAGMPTNLRGLRREHVESYVVALQDAGKRPATVTGVSQPATFLQVGCERARD
jgi:site-specific recombinase XerD